MGYGGMAGAAGVGAGVGAGEACEGEELCKGGGFLGYPRYELAGAYRPHYGAYQSDASPPPELLLGAGVTDEWKNHTDLEPFYAA